MIELQREALVHETRSAFQRAMEGRFIAVSVDRATRPMARPAAVSRLASMYVEPP